MYPLLYFITRWELFRVLEKLFVAAFAEAPILKFENKTPHKLFFARNKTWHSHVGLHKSLEYFKPELTQDHILLAHLLHFLAVQDSSIGDIVSQSVSQSLSESDF